MNGRSYRGVVVGCVLAIVAGAEVGLEPVWVVEGKGAFSAPNAVRDATTGRFEAIVACERDRGVVCFDLQGQRKWVYPMTAPVTAAPAVADVDDEGSEEVVAADATGRLAVLRNNGSLLWDVQLPGAVAMATCPAVVDIDGDGHPEVLAGDDSGAVSCLDRTGRLLWRFTGDGTRTGPLLVADVYDSPGKEIIVPSHDRHIYALTARGEWIWDIYREDDLFPESNLLLADADGDGIPELYVGGGLHHFYRIDLQKPAVVFEENIYMHINGAISAGDLDGDGKDEVVFGNKGGGVWCYGDSGFRWKDGLVRAGFFVAPAIMDVDPREGMEVLFFSSAGRICVLAADGAQLRAADIPWWMIDTPIVGDLDGDGVAEIVAACQREGSLTFAKLGVPCPSNALVRVFCGDRAHSGRPEGAKAYTPIKMPQPAVIGGGASGSSRPGVTPHGEPLLLSGPNTWRFDVINPAQQRLLLLTEVLYPNGSVHRFARHAYGSKQRVTFQVSAETPGAYKVTRRLLDADERAVLADVESLLRFDGFAGDAAYLEKKVFPAAEAALDTWRTTNARSAEAFLDEMTSLRGMLTELARTESPDRVRESALLRASAERSCALATAGSALAPTGSFFVWQFTPWAYFHPRETLPLPTNRTECLKVALCGGEYESLALNVTNVSGRTLEVRVSCNNLDGPSQVSVDSYVEFRRAVVTPTVHREMVADALPRLDEAGTLSIAPFETQQLWITVKPPAFAPGEYTASLRLKSIEVEPTEVTLPLHVMVHPLQLPRPRPLRFIVWTMWSGSLSTAEDAVLQDLIDHGVTVFLAPSPKAEADAEGNLVGSLDFSEHDAVVKRMSPHGFLLFTSPQGGVTGPGFLSDAWNKAFVAFLRQWAAHLKQLGLDYDDWALYPYDEPSAPHAETTLNLVEVAKVVRSADPNILIYTDPTSGTTMECVKMFTGLIDIWQPSSELLERLGPELVPEAKRVGKEVWFYDAAGNAKTLSCLGIYRWRFWYAWELGLTGVGWWVYSAHGKEDRWDGPNKSGDFFASVYDGPTGPVTSKRWEVAREGIEDYEYLCMLRQSIQEAEASGAPADRIAQAKDLLEKLPKEVEAALHKVGRRLPLTPDSVPVYDEATKLVQDARARIVSMCLALKK